MLTTINYNDATLKHSKKIKNKISKDLSFLPKAFWQANPIISGGYAIHLVFKPNCIYDDIDFYFSNQNDYFLAKKIISNLSKENRSKNSGTFFIQGKKIQLVNKFFAPPEKILYMHDFKNSSICITESNIHLDGEIFDLYYNNELSIRSTQITSQMSDESKILKIGLLYNRILKYQNRYDFTLDKKSNDILLKLNKYLNTIPKETLSDLIIDTNIYYNGSYSSYHKNLRSMLEIRKHINSYLSPS